MMPDPVELRVASAPFWHNGSRVSARNGNIILAALIPVVAGLFRHGLPAIDVVLLSIFSATLWELAMDIIARRKISIFHGNAVLIGLLLSMLLPAASPCWLVIVSTFFAIGVVKGIYGKTGMGPFHPVAVSILLLIFLQSRFLGLNSAIFNCRIGFNPAFHPTPGLMAMLMGHQSGGLGSTFGLGLIIGGIYLMLRGYIRWEIALSFLAGMFATGLCFYVYKPSVYAGPMYQILTGYSLVAAFFLATDDATSPVNFVSMLIYGAMGGTLTVLFRNTGYNMDGAIFAVLIINLLNPLIDLIRPKALYGTYSK